jgi:hypothetical protein
VAGVAFLQGIPSFCGAQNVVNCVVDCGELCRFAGSWTPQIGVAKIFLVCEIFLWIFFGADSK